jgi:protein N-terminal amidase
MRIACVQLDSKLGQFDMNVATVERLLHRRRHELNHLDLLVLPELALIGYCFRDRAEIEPFAETRTDGPTIEWLRKLAVRLDCTVACGFAEKDGVVLYNSMAVMHRSGQLVHVHRKHFLFHMDEPWASPGPGFACRELPDLGPTGFAICMDLNPKGFVAPFEAYEYGSSLYEPPLKEGEKPTTHLLQANLVIASNAWLRSTLETEVTEEQRSLSLMNYWATRLLPVLDRPVILALANRVGIERGTTFAGTSCVLDLGRRQILGNLGTTEEDVLIVDAAS